MLKLALLATAVIVGARVAVDDLSAALGGAGGFSGLIATCDFAVPTADGWSSASRIANGIKNNAGHTRLYINSIHVAD